MKKIKNNKKVSVGWICPACGCGNAPMALKCYHCPKITYNNQSASAKLFKPRLNPNVEELDDFKP